MRFTRTIVLLLAATAVLSAQRASDPRLSARAAVQKTQPEVLKRFPDAILTSISTNDVDGQGNASWSVGYYSSSTSRHLSGAVHERLITVLESTFGVDNALPVEFLDSKEALDRAKAVGLNNGTTFMNLIVDGKHKIAAWSVGTSGQRIVLNAVTGAMLELESK